MRRNHLFIAALVLLTSTADAQLRKIVNNAFTFGERLEYRVHYGIINAARVTMEVSQGTQVVNGHNCFHILAEGKTISSFDWMFKVRDKFESYVDQDALVPFKYVKAVREDNYTDSDFVFYDQVNHKLSSTKLDKPMPTPANVQDVISAAYYARTIDFTKAKIGESFPISIYLDQKIYNLEFKFAGRETINSDIGKVRCIVLRPKVVVDRVFKSEEAMTVWISDDENKIPIRVKSEIAVGSIKVDITAYKGLKNGFTAKL